MLTNYDKHTHGSLPGTLYFFYESDHDFVPFKYILVGLRRRHSIDLSLTTISFPRSPQSSWSYVQRSRAGLFVATL